MTELLLVILCAYLLGSVSGSLVLGRLRGVDIRSSGSGNAGGTNALRSQGVTFALLVIVIDIGKGVLAVLYLPAWWPAANADLAAWQPMSAGLAAIIGHVWPLYFGFRGGKGMATLAGVTAVLMPGPGLLVLLLWLMIVLFSAYVGLASVCAGLALPVVVLLWQIGADVARHGWYQPGAQLPWSESAQLSLLLFAVVSALFVLWTHRDNIRRLRQGREYRFEQRRWFSRPVQTTATAPADQGENEAVQQDQAADDRSGNPP